MSGSAYSTLMIEHAALGKPYRIRVDENSSLPLLYIDDAINALIKLYSAPPERLTRRFYNLGGFVATAGEIREHVRKNIPDSVLDFQPNPEVVNSVAILPKIFDDSKARQDWSWEITYDLPRAVSAFIRAVRENPAFFMATESAPRPIGKP